SPTLSDIATALSTHLGWALSETDLARMTGEIPVGGWLVARLLAEITDSDSEPPGFDTFGALITARIERAFRASGPDPARVLSVIAAAGDRPVLPIRLLAAAVGDSDTAFPRAAIRDSVVHLGALISRGNPGTDHETLGISHQALLGPVTSHTEQLTMPMAE